MGQFSWLLCDKGNDEHYAMLDNVTRDSYLLVPPPFQSKYGKYIKETCYDGYGDMGGYDVYDLVAEWNKAYIPEIIKQRNGKMASGQNMNVHNLMAFYNDEPYDCPLRYLGIELACYDKDNANLPFPIKIASVPLPYNSVPASESDPNQGWGCDDEEDEYDEYDEDEEDEDDPDDDGDED